MSRKRTSLIPSRNTSTQPNTPSRNTSTQPNTSSQNTSTQPNTSSQNTSTQPNTPTATLTTTQQNTPSSQPKKPPFKLIISPEILASIDQTSSTPSQSKISSTLQLRSQLTASRTTTPLLTPPRLKIQNNTSSNRIFSQPSSRTPPILSDIIKRYPNIHIPRSYQTSRQEAYVLSYQPSSHEEEAVSGK